jgi:hypothetical protein
MKMYEIVSFRRTRHSHGWPGRLAMRQPAIKATANTTTSATSIMV